jgi:hypothetical protein
LGSEKASLGCDSGEVAYASTRCGALYGVIGAYFSNSGSKTEKNQASDLTSRGLLLLLVGDQFAESIGWSGTNRQNRANELSSIYIDVVAQNRVEHNNLFHGVVERDYRFCLSLEQAMRDIARTLENKK